VVCAVGVIAVHRVLAARCVANLRVARWLAAHVVAPREAWRALPFVTAGWLVRTAALVTLLAALGLQPSVPVALAFLCGSAASGLVPIAPAGAATQAGAGAAVLVAAGVAPSQAVAFGVAVQALGLLASASVLTAALGLWAGRLGANRLTGRTSIA
jgi:hypothetical protein